MNDEDERTEIATMIASIALDVLERLEDDPEARFAFFRDYVELAMRAINQDYRISS